MFSLFREQPRAFHLIFMTEIWERFGFYTVQGILTLFFIRYLGLSDNDSYYTFGAFSALVYGMVVIGGYLGDKILGVKRTIVLGLITLALGYLALALANKSQVYFALGLICVGNGLFKANPPNLLAKCYEEQDPRLHGAFTLYYMAINLGSTFSLFIGPTLASHFGYSYAYFTSFIGLLLGLINFWFRRYTIAAIKTPADEKMIPWWGWILVLIGILLTAMIASFLLDHPIISKKIVWAVTLAVIGIYLYYLRKMPQKAFWRMLVALILMVEAVVFFTLYQQMPTSLNLFAVNNVRPSLFGIPIDPQSFQALNPIWIIIMSPVLAFLYKKLTERGFAATIPYKFAAGMFCCAISFGLLYFARFSHNETGVVSSGWLVASYFFQSTGELFVSALGAAMVAELVPNTITGFVIGMWFLTSSVAGFIGAYVASFTALPKHIQPGVESLLIYTQVFGSIGLTILTIGIIMWLSAAKLNQFIK